MLWGLVEEVGELGPVVVVVMRVGWVEAGEEVRRSVVHKTNPPKHTLVHDTQIHT